MRVPDRCLADLRERGYLLFEGFIDDDELAAACRRSPCAARLTCVRSESRAGRRTR
jgi:hypothetical protein